MLQQIFFPMNEVMNVVLSFQ